MPESQYSRIDVIMLIVEYKKILFWEQRRQSCVWNYPTHYLKIHPSKLIQHPRKWCTLGNCVLFVLLFLLVKVEDGGADDLELTYSVCCQLWWYDCDGDTLDDDAEFDALGERSHWSLSVHSPLSTSFLPPYPSHSYCHPRLFRRCYYHLTLEIKLYFILWWLWSSWWRYG